MIFRAVQFNSSRLRFYLLNLRMHRYFKRNASMDKIRHFVTKCSRGDWFVLYQLSKNLNRPFFMDFLTTLARKVDPEEETEGADHGDGVMDMLMKPTLQTYDSKEAPKAAAESDGDD